MKNLEQQLKYAEAMGALNKAAQNKSKMSTQQKQVTGGGTARRDNESFYARRRELGWSEREIEAEIAATGTGEPMEPIKRGEGGSTDYLFEDHSE